MNTKAGDTFQVVKDITLTSNTGVSIRIPKGIRLVVIKVYDGLISKSLTLHEGNCGIEINLPESFFDHVYQLDRIS